jgi:single-strand DNA-binding protein
MPNLKVPEINQVALSGRLCQDPESRIMESGKLLVTFTLAANLNFRGKNGEWQQDATFVPVSVWDKAAEYAAERLRKASVFVTGRLRSRVVKSSGGKRTILEVTARHIQFLDRLEKEEQENAPPF